MANALMDFSNSLADTVERAGKSVVGIAEGGRHGVSGIVWRNDVVVTAEHTVRGREQVTLILPNGETTTGTISGRDPGSDVATVSVANINLPVTQSADSAQARVGHIVFAVGRRGHDGLASSYGVISAVGGPWRTWQGGRVDRSFRLDLLPYPGFSGGPLVDAQGHTLGMNTSGPHRSVLSIPSSTVDRIVKQLLEKGRITRGYLGAGVQPVMLPEAARKALGDDREAGLLVVTVAPSGPAERGGLLIGDVLLAVDDKPLHTLADLQPVTDPEHIGNTRRIKVLRGGKPAELSIVIGERPTR